jgi:hypothetical protein
VFQEKYCLNNPPEKGADHGDRYGNLDKITGNLSEDCSPFMKPSSRNQQQISREKS